MLPVFIQKKQSDRNQKDFPKLIIKNFARCSDAWSQQKRK
jgi:hypothetical protein